MRHHATVLAWCFTCLSQEQLCETCFLWVQLACEGCRSYVQHFVAGQPAEVRTSTPWICCCSYPGMAQPSRWPGRERLSPPRAVPTAVRCGAVRRGACFRVVVHQARGAALEVVLRRVRELVMAECDSACGAGLSRLGRVKKCDLPCVSIRCKASTMTSRSSEAREKRFGALSLFLWILVPGRGRGNDVTVCVCVRACLRGRCAGACPAAALLDKAES